MLTGTHMYVCTSKPLSRNIHIYLSTHASSHACLRLCTPISAHLLAFASVHLCMHILMQIYTYMHVSTHILLYLCTSIHVRTSARQHICTSNHARTSAHVHLSMLARPPQAPPGAGKTTAVPLALLRHSPPYLRNGIILVSAEVEGGGTGRRWDRRGKSEAACAGGTRVGCLYD